jgi:hypothetical protein
METKRDIVRPPVALTLAFCLRYEPRTWLGEKTSHVVGDLSRVRPCRDHAMAGDGSANRDTDTTVRSEEKKNFAERAVVRAAGRRGVVSARGLAREAAGGGQ